MMHWLIDSHCHVDLLKDIPIHIQSEDSLPIKTIAVTNTPQFYEHNLINFTHLKNICIALGYHPELVVTYPNELQKFEQLLPSTRYVGEIGLDGSKQHKQNFDTQLKIFSRIIELISNSGNKIVSIHTRQAVQETIQILRLHNACNNNKIILHWYTGNINDLKSAIEIGCYLSINHKMVITQKGIETIKNLPLNRILTETDAPFTLRENENRLDSLDLTIKGISEILRVSQDDIKSAVFNNFKEILS